MARTGQTLNAYRILVRKYEGKTFLGRRRHVRDDNTKTDLKVGSEVLDCTELAPRQSPVTGSQLCDGPSRSIKGRNLLTNYQVLKCCGRFIATTCQQAFKYSDMR